MTRAGKVREVDTTEEHTVAATDELNGVDGVPKAEAGSRILHLELIRLVAIFLVLFNHTGERGYSLYALTDSGVARPFYMILSILSKVAVPLFFMVSGALLVPKEESIATVFRRRVLRMAIVLILFSAAFYFSRVVTGNEDQGFRGFLTALYSSPVTGSYWFLYAYLALLVMLPFLRRLARGMTTQEYLYLIVLQVILVGLWPVVGYLGGLEPLQGSLRVALVEQSAAFFFLIGYFVEYKLCPLMTTRRILYGLGLAAVSVGLTLAVTLVLLDRSPDISLDGAELFFDGLVAIPAIMAYVLLRLVVRRPPADSVQKAIIWLGGTAFGIYLIDPFLRQYGVLDFVFTGVAGTIHALPAAVLWVVAILLVAALLTGLLKIIPGFKKLL